MKSLKQEAIVNVYEMLLERFGEPVGSYEGDLSGVRDENPHHCDQCGGMMPMEGITCDSCGMMPEANYEEYVLGLDKDHETLDNIEEAKPMINRPKGKEKKLDLESDNALDQKAPPGGEKVVRALKKKKGVKNPWATAWSMKNKGEI